MAMILFVNVIHLFRIALTRPQPPSCRHRALWLPGGAIALKPPPRGLERVMNFLRIYGRVLGLLGSEARLGWFLAGANVALAAAQFAEPVLLGRIIDALVGRPLHRAQASV